MGGGILRDRTIWVGGGNIHSTGVGWIQDFDLDILNAFGVLLEFPSGYPINYKNICMKLKRDLG